MAVILVELEERKVWLFTSYHWEQNFLILGMPSNHTRGFHNIDESPSLNFTSTLISSVNSLYVVMVYVQYRGGDSQVLAKFVNYWASGPRYLGVLSGEMCV